MTIKEMARTDVVTADPETTTRKISALLEEKNVGSVIVTEDETPVGIVTDRDLALDVIGEGKNSATIAAADVMTEDLFTVETDESIYDVLEGMRERGVRRVPVVEDGDLAGIVTLDDFIVLLTSELENVSGVVQAGISDY
ncbi:CBS domain-containing protein [Halovenus aranensis]|jgi:CBS domain-containing protein|uniref:CBS domain-containing protein n=1 Tax=Halovenus aranensis TaxID=890420 RepID=A0A1G8YFA6_9EURY|nr:CBS domain-containing protein [Halovenus aranensis]SDK01542.1 CBS domain-containing protein [Halovenus aranensis]